MGFFDASIIDASAVKKGATAVATTQASIKTVVPAPSTAVTQAVNTSVVGTTGAMSGITSVTTNTPPVAVQTSNKNLSVASAIAIGTDIAKALNSITGTFGGSKTSLATGISSSLANIFTNTNNPAASTTTTVIPDPVTTNLLSTKTPGSTAFVVNGMQAGSQPVSIAGSSSILGSGSALMTGVSIATLINRLSLDSSSNVTSAITNAQTTNTVNGLFTSLSAPSTDPISILSGNPSTTDFVSSTTPTTPGSISVLSGLAGTASSNPNDLSAFLGASSSLSQALGVSNTSLSSYYVTNPNYTLINQNGTAVSTNNSGVDATIANAIVNLASQAGCTTSNTSYTSANITGSLFSTALSLAAQSGMGDVVSSLLGCSAATSPTAQQSITTAFASSAGSQIGIANTLLGSVLTPATLNTPYITQSMVTNPNLTVSDLPTLESMYATMGTSTTQALSVPSVSSTDYSVYDLSTLYQTQPSVVDGITGDTTLTDYMNGYDMNYQDDGSFSLDGFY